MTRRTTAALVAALVVVLVAGAVLALRSVRGDEPAPRPAAAPEPTPTTGTPTPTPTAAARPPTCPTTARPFTPTSVRIAGRTLPVIAPPRDAAGVPGTPPLSTAGKWVVAFDPDQGVRPGDSAGHVLLNAHTWPDGTALGNRLLDRLHRGDRIVLRAGDRRLCYRVDERLEVLASRGLPRYYATDGPPAIAIVVCSGRRLGPGQWEERTVWFASPRA